MKELLESQDMASLIVIFAFALFVFCIVNFLLFRWIFSVKKQLNNQKTVINLLIMLIEKDGETQVTREIWKENNSEDLK